jgi:hypothetical protein
MARPKPNIDITSANLVKDRQEFQNFILDVIKDTFIYSYTPNQITLDVTNTLFTLYLYNKSLLVDTLEVDNVADYVDVYLFGVKQPQDRYTVLTNDSDIIIQFNVDITRIPQDVVVTDFLIKGKIVEIE